MGKRHSDAIAIQLGAVNPSAIAISIADACREIRAEPNHTGTAQITGDPAIRLMVHQLAFICGLSSRFEPPDMTYSKSLMLCEAAVQVTALDPNLCSNEACQKSGECISMVNDNTTAMCSPSNVPAVQIPAPVRSGYEAQGTAYDPNAAGYELQGRDKAPDVPTVEKHGYTQSDVNAAADAIEQYGDDALEEFKRDITRTV